MGEWHAAKGHEPELELAAARTVRSAYGAPAQASELYSVIFF